MRPVSLPTYLQDAKSQRMSECGNLTAAVFKGLSMPGPHGGFDPATRERWQCRYCKQDSLSERTLKLELKECAGCDREHQVCLPCFSKSLGKVFGEFPEYVAKLRGCPKDGILIEPIDSFRGHCRFLSNYYPVSIDFEGASYTTVEHAYQAAKTLNPLDRERIRNYAKPGEAKKRGKCVVLRPDWEAVKFQIMTDLVRRKFMDGSGGFRQNPGYLRNALLKTGDRPLIEGNTWGDRIWGVDENGVGENHLGKILMQVRVELRKTPVA